MTSFWEAINIIFAAIAQLVIDPLIDEAQDQHSCIPYLSGLVKSVPVVSVLRQLIHHSAQARNQTFFLDRGISNQLTQRPYKFSSIACG